MVLHQVFKVLMHTMRYEQMSQCTRCVHFRWWPKEENKRIPFKLISWYRLYFISVSTIILYIIMWLTTNLIYSIYLFICSFVHNQLFFHICISKFQSSIICCLTECIFITMCSNQAQTHTHTPLQLMKQTERKTINILSNQCNFFCCKSSFSLSQSHCLSLFHLQTLVFGLFAYLFMIFFTFHHIVTMLCATWPHQLTFSKLNMCVAYWLSIQFPFVLHFENFPCILYAFIQSILSGHNL